MTCFMDKLHMENGNVKCSHSGITSKLLHDYRLYDIIVQNF